MVLAAVTTPTGGTAKTTTAMFTGAGLAKHGTTVVIDTDPQQTAMMWAQDAGQLGFDVRSPYNEPELTGEGDPLGLVGIARQYKHVIVDCPPGDLDIIEQVVSCVELIIAPIRASWVSIRHAQEMIDLVSNRRTPDGLPLLRWLITQGMHGTRALADTRRVLTRRGELVFEAWVPLMPAVLAEAGGQPITDLGPYAAVVDELMLYDRALDDI